MFDLVLINSQSTVDLFTNPDHIQNMGLANHPIWVHCNKGMLVTTEEADFGDTPVHFTFRDIANVLLFYRLSKNSESLTIAVIVMVSSKSTQPKELSNLRLLQKVCML